MKEKVTAVFDIGKTNKKFFLFDKDYREIYRDYVNIKEIEDEDGFSCDDLNAIEHWVKSTFDHIIGSEKYIVEAVNFSSYGASLVHIDENGMPILPLYNYLKPIPEKYLDKFILNYGPIEKISTETASPEFGMLSSGLQLYWIKQAKPEIYHKIKFSLHLPNYLSYIFTGIATSDYTSIGCHTMLWHYGKKDYHDWIYEEKLDAKLAPIQTTNKYVTLEYMGQNINFGCGIHDSSSALLPYLFADKNKFVLISTGTWNVSLNPFMDFNEEGKELKEKPLNYMKIDGTVVGATKVFLGNEYNIQLKNLCEYFQAGQDESKTIPFSPKLYFKLLKIATRHFKFESIASKDPVIKETNYASFSSFQEAYHQLMIELIEVQLDSLFSCIGSSKIERIYVDGGFSNNEIFMKLLSFHLKKYELRSTESSFGSALGAAIMVSNNPIGFDFLDKNYNMKKIDFENYNSY